MFRVQQNAFDEVVGKATDENLTSENWELILDVCDRVGAHENGAKDAVAAMIKRLAHRNANVQLYTLELANALSQNCGPKIHTELASRSFTEALLRLAAERNSHPQVKTKILERMAEWTEMFSKTADLGIMEQAYMRLKSQNPNLHPPSKPVKSQITDADRRKEEEELQMALALSIKDKASASRPTAESDSYNAEGASGGGPSASATGAYGYDPTTVLPSGKTAATVSRVRALFDFQPSEPGELQFRKGDVIAVLESVYKDWWNGSLRGQTGIFPLNYVEKLQDPTKEELEREAQMEAEVFGQIRNVEKLLALLSTSSRTGDGAVRNSEEITALYHTTLAIRPKLIELIGKYSQKKDDFTQLNEKFIKARRDYETLLEASMSQPQQAQQHAYGRPQQYAYPPQQANAYTRPLNSSALAGAIPAQNHPPHDPQNYYNSSSAQEQQQAPPQASYGSGQPPLNGTQPFYIATDGQQQTRPEPTDASSPSLKSSVPYMSIGPHQGRPNVPQELSSGVYPAPYDAVGAQGHAKLPQQAGQPAYSPSQAQSVQQRPYDAASSHYGGGGNGLSDGNGYYPQLPQSHPPSEQAYPPPHAPSSSPPPPPQQQQQQQQPLQPQIHQITQQLSQQQLHQASQQPQSQVPGVYPATSPGYVAYQPGHAPPQWRGGEGLEG